MSINKLFLLEIKELKYNRLKLLEIFNQVKSYARVKGLPWNSNDSLEIDDANCIVIQYGDYMIADPSKKSLSCNLLAFPYIQNLVNRLNFSHEISPGNVDILWYRKGASFQPHVDHYAASTMMFPIDPEDADAPIDFYYEKSIALEQGVAQHFGNVLTDKNIIYSHQYSTSYPTIFNSHWIHGVKNVSRDRVYFRIRINENFSSIKEKYKQGTLLK
jgi:hypothetical protein